MSEFTTTTKIAARPRPNTLVEFELEDGKHTGSVSYSNCTDGGFFISYRDWWFEQQSAVSTKVKNLKVF
jgi:hypothetical protein